MEPHLPAEIMYRRKQGFAVPLASWFRGPLRTRVREALLGDRLANTGLFSRAALRNIIEEHDSGARDHGAPIWSLLMFEAFLRSLQGGESITGAAPSTTTMHLRSVAA